MHRRGFVSGLLAMLGLGATAPRATYRVGEGSIITSGLPPPQRARAAGTPADGGEIHYLRYRYHIRGLGAPFLGWHVAARIDDFAAGLRQFWGDRLEFLELGPVYKQDGPASRPGQRGPRVRVPSAPVEQPRIRPPSPNARRTLGGDMVFKRCPRCRKAFGPCYCSCVCDSCGRGNEACLPVGPPGDQLLLCDRCRLGGLLTAAALLPPEHYATWKAVMRNRDGSNETEVVWAIKQLYPGAK